MRWAAIRTRNTGEWTTLQGIGSDLAEVRDLGWVLLKQDQPYWGLTFIAGLVPIPSFASDFTQTYHLRTVTLNAIGFPLTAAHGGLRITYSGEWYLNFGWPGVVVGGLLYGWMCSRFSSLFHRLRAASQLYPVGAYMVASAWATASFMVYMSGSASGGTLKTYAFVLVVFLFRLRRTNRVAVQERAVLIPAENGKYGWLDKMNEYCVNARFVTRPFTGVQRYSYEVSLRLRNGRFIAPRPAHKEYGGLQARVVVAGGRLNGHPWEQIALPWAIPRRHAIVFTSRLWAGGLSQSGPDNP